jgi:biopolymer transport protein ExbD
MAATNSDHFELNLTPLLDVVMQLIMFFMMCVNFVSDQVSQNVVLPASLSAQEIMPKTDIDVLVINVEVKRKVRYDGDGRPLRTPDGKIIRDLEPDQQGRKQTKIIFSGYDESKWFTDDTEAVGIDYAQRKLAILAKDYRKKESLKESLRTGKTPEKVDLKTIVVIRADTDTRYGLVVSLIAQCTKEGFAKVEVRALSSR